jgi:uncharacterized repeat protein (TIGR03803 family)
VKFLRILVAITALTYAGKADGQSFTTLHQFNGKSDGCSPTRGLTQGGDGYLYGTTFRGGTNNQGTVYRVTPVGALTTLWQFTGGADGSHPDGGVVKATDGYLYGTTVGGGTNNDGTVFKITSTGELTTLYQFSGHADRGSPGPLVLARDGDFYGTSIALWGTIFKVNSAGVLNTLWRFSDGTDGSNPNGRLVQESDGYFYGTTTQGGTNNGWGTIFKISSTGTLTTLFTFHDAGRGGSPESDLVHGADGAFYGTTALGRNGHGMVFKITSTGTLTVLHQLEGDEGDFLFSGLVQGSDGYFYGSSVSLKKRLGTLFRISSTGVLTTLHRFAGGADGTIPRGPLVQGDDGYLYGTADGGTNDAGTIFKLSIPH